MADTDITARDRITNHLLERGTRAAPDMVRGRLADAYRDFDELMATLPVEMATADPGDGQWSVRDVVDHLLESERQSLEELRCLMAGERPPSPPIAASLRSRAPHRRPWPWLVREIAQVHADILEALADGREAHPNEAQAALVLVVSVPGEDGTPVPVEWIDEFDWRAYAACLRVHTKEHLDQIRKTVRT